MATSRAWSNALIIGCTVVVAYAALVLGSIYAHRAHAAHMAGHAAPPHHGPPCMLERFAWLCAATGVTGMIAGCSLKKRWLYAFPVMLLLTELIILAHVSHGAVRAVERCTVEAERVNEVVAIERVDIAPGVALQRERAYVSRPYVDERARLGCVDGVRHAVFMACLVVGVVCSSLMCCGSRLAASLEREADAAAAANDTAVTAVVVMCDAEKAPLVRAKADPLAADEDEELATGKIAL